jgi:hypothetical protein
MSYPALSSIHSTTCFDLCPKETMMNESQSNDVQNLFDTMVSLFVQLFKAKQDHFSVGVF